MFEARWAIIRRTALDDDGQPISWIEVEEVTVHPLECPGCFPEERSAFDPQAEPVRRIMARRAEEQAGVVRAAIRDAGRVTVMDEDEMRRRTRRHADPFGLDGWA